VNGDLRVLQGGSGDPLLVLLHGLGATADVWCGWQPLLARRWPGPWIAPDLPGHGGSPPLASYTFEGLAAAVAPLVQDSAHIVIVGHSLGGVVGLALADERLGLPVRAVVGLGVKVTWAAEDLDALKALADRPPSSYATRDKAATRYLRVSGLDGLLPVGDPAVDPGLREQDGRWGLAMDPGAYRIGAPDMGRLLARTRATVTLARGEYDPMNTDEQLAALVSSTVTLPGLAHSAHVQNPELSIALLDALR
jgi:pimeloyl-ACP methyl ester carboxylesterase